MEPLRRALEPFLGLPGAFVMGDHDYRTTTFKLPTRYLRADPRAGDDPQAEARVAELPWREVRDLQTSGGWADLCNARGAIAVRGRRIDLVGVDDPHAERDSYPAAPEASAPPEAPTPSGPSEAEAPREPTARYVIVSRIYCNPYYILHNTVQIISLKEKKWRSSLKDMQKSRTVKYP